MSSFNLMPDPLDVREITFTNLLLLGFDPESYEARFRIPFTRDMFSVPNRKAMEVVIHFLFTKLNHDSAKETFRHCWPIGDKKQEQEFRKLVIEWTTKIKKDDSESHLPSLVPSLLLSPTGDRFYQFLFYLSTYVVKQKLSPLCGKSNPLPSWPRLSSVNKNYMAQLKKGLIIATKKQELRLASYLNETAEVKDKWMEFSKELSKEHRKLCKKKRECEKQLREVKEYREAVFGKSTFSSKDSIERTQKLQKLTEFWKSISKLYESQKYLQTDIRHLVDKNQHTQCINGDDIQFKIPDVLLQECEYQLNMGRRYQNIYEDGKINLTNLIELWNLALHLIKEIISQYPLPNVDHDEAYIRAEAHNHVNSLNSFNSLKHNLMKQMLPDLQLSIEELKLLIDDLEMHKPVVNRQMRTTPHTKDNAFVHDILPATPPVNFDMVADDSTTNPTLRKFSSNEQDKVNTPDAINTILRNLKKDVSHLEADDTTPVLKRTLPPQKQIHVSNANRELQLKNDRIFQTSEAEQRPPHNSRIPVTKNKQRLPVPTQTKTEISKTTNENAMSIANFSKAQEMLIDQIAGFVMNGDATSLMNSTDEEEQQEQNESVHALENPVEAFSQNAFVSRDKVPRTPAPKRATKKELGNRNEIVESNTVNEREMDGIREKLGRLNASYLPNTESLENKDSCAKDSDLSIIQDRIRAIQLRGRQEENRIPYGQQQIKETSPNIETPFHNIRTPKHRVVSPIHESPFTPYKFSLDCDPPTSFTTSPASLNDHNVNEAKFDAPVNASIPDNDKTPPDLFNNLTTPDNLMTNKLYDQLLMFTPFTNKEDQPNNQLPFMESANHQSQLSNNEDMKLFLQNNKHILDMTPKLHNQTPGGNTCTPTYTAPCYMDKSFQFSKPADSVLCTSRKLETENVVINYITPFKDPFSPDIDNQLNKDSGGLQKGVSDFTDESFAKTPAFSTITKKTLFSTATPQFTNDYSLMTPGYAPKDFNFSFDKDDDEL